MFWTSLNLCRVKVIVWKIVLSHSVVKHSVFLILDAVSKNYVDAVISCFSCRENRSKVINDISTCCTTKENPNYVLPCLSVRSGFDLYLKVMAFPPGSEVIMSAINIPDMVAVVKHHKLKV